MIARTLYADVPSTAARRQGRPTEPARIQHDIVAAQLRASLERALQPSHLEIEDEVRAPRTVMPAGATDGETHFRVTRGQRRFDGRSRIERQRLVHAPRGDLMVERIHALVDQRADARRGRSRSLSVSRARCTSADECWRTTSPSRARAWQLSRWPRRPVRVPGRPARAPDGIDRLVGRRRQRPEQLDQMGAALDAAEPR